MTFLLRRAQLARRVRGAIAADGGDVLVPRRAVAAASKLPILRQALRNNCETAALSMLLAARGRRAGQLALQRQLPRSKPIDPIVNGQGETTWGDPAAGFVGRPEGGGPAGGYGVYEGPVKALARRERVELRVLSRQPARAIYASLLQGKPVMVWIGLSDGPYKAWRTPAGKRVVGNFGEHTVVLTGVSGARLAVNDPLTGQRRTWTRAQFETMWRRLGRRALAI